MGESDSVRLSTDKLSYTLQRERLGIQWEKGHRNPYIFNQYYEASLKAAEGNKEAFIAFGINMRKVYDDAMNAVVKSQRNQKISPMIVVYFMINLVLKSVFVLALAQKKTFVRKTNYGKLVLFKTIKYICQTYK